MTQIIERVARAMYNREHKATPWELVKPTLRQDYINLAQAALKEIKFEQLVGALKDVQHKIAAAASGGFIDEEAVLNVYLTNQVTSYLLSELEKTE